MRRQVGELNIHSRYLFDVAHDYAEKLLATFPAELSNLVLTCTGSESNDLALRLAKKASGGSGFVVTRTAYHGNTAAVTEVSPSSYKTGGPPPHVRMVPPPDPAIFGNDVAQGFADAVSGAIAAMEADGIRFAGLLVDTIFSSDGVFADPPGLLKPAIAAVHAAGGLFIADEVQPGFGRTGEGMWGFARHGVMPDVVTMGKPMGNGYPIAGVVTRPEILADFCADFGYFNTFAASPVATAAALAVLEAIEEDGLIANAASVGRHLMGRLEAAAGQHADHRGARRRALSRRRVRHRGGPDARHRQGADQWPQGARHIDRRRRAIWQCAEDPPAALRHHRACRHSGRHHGRGARRTGLARADPSFERSRRRLQHAGADRFADRGVHAGEGGGLGSERRRHHDAVGPGAGDGKRLAGAAIIGLHDRDGARLRHEGGGFQQRGVGERARDVAQ